MTINPKNNLKTNKVNTRFVLIGLSLAILMSSIDSTIVTVGLPTIAKDLNSSYASMQWIILSYLLSITTFIIGIGRIGDMLGKKRLYLWGIAIFTIASLLCGLSSTIVFLIVSRVAQGIGASVLMALSFALVGDAVPKERMAHAMGILTSVLTLGIALGPSLGGVLIEIFGWHIIFLVNVPIGIATFVIALKFPESEVAEKRLEFDWLGVIVLAGTLICYNMGITLSESQGGRAIVILLMLLSVVGAILFVRIEKRVASPLINFELFRDRIISGSLGISVLLYAVIMCVGMVLPFYLANAQGRSTFEVGLLVAVGPLATTIMGPIAAKVATRFGNRHVMIAGMIGFGFGCFLMTTLTPNTSALGFALRIAISNGSFAFFQTPNNAAIMVSAKPEQRGVVSGLLNLARTLGQTTGAALMGAIFANLTLMAERKFEIVNEATTVSLASPEAISAGTRGTYYVATFGVIIAIAIGIIMLYHKRKHILT